MLADVVKTLIFCIALRSVATQGQQRAKYHKGGVAGPDNPKIQALPKLG